MIRTILITGQPAQLHVDGSKARYHREGAEPLETTFEIHATGPATYWVTIGPRSYRVTRTAPGEVQVNGRRIEVEVLDPRALRTGAKTGAATGQQQITAPMPGKVVSILVAPGDSVEAGQGVVVVEAMKMQNEMKSPQAGTVREVRTRAGATVAAGEILIVIE